MTDKTELEVTQADRDAAADLIGRIGLSWSGDMIRDGKSDDHAYVQAFARHRLATRTPDPTPVAWMPIESAPKDGTMLRLFVDYTNGDHPLDDATKSWTIGFNGFEDTGEDEWKFAGWCWTHDHFVEGKGVPIGWQPLPPAPGDAPVPPAVPDDGLVGALMEAYVAGATDVHNSWVSETNGHEPDFGEAASDYAHSVTLAAYRGEA